MFRQFKATYKSIPGTVINYSGSGKSYWFRPDGWLDAIAVPKEKIIPIDDPTTWVSLALEGKTIPAIKALRDLIYMENKHKNIPERYKTIGLIEAKCIVLSVQKNAEIN